MQNARELATAWGEWLSGYEWDCWATLTFKEDYTPDAATRAFERWTSWIERENPRLGYFVGHEVGGLGKLHLHALLGGLDPNCRRSVLWKRWKDRHGRAQLLPYDREAGAAYYVAKYVTKGFSHYDIQPIKPAPNQGILWLSPASAGTSSCTKTGKKPD